MNEIRDLNEEHAKEQSEYFETVQAYERELGLYKDILKAIIFPKEQAKLEQKCTYDAENKKWTVPMFDVVEKKINFTKLKLRQKMGREINIA